MSLRSQHPSDGKLCWSCKKPLVLPPRIKIDDDIVLLNRTTQLFGYHVGQTHDDDILIADVVQNPQVQNLFGLRNLTKEAWTLTKSDGTVVDVPPRTCGTDSRR